MTLNNYQMVFGFLNIDKVQDRNIVEELNNKKSKYYGRKNNTMVQKQLVSMDYFDTGLHHNPYFWI